MKCWILEINDHPSFNIYVCKQPKTKGVEKIECKHENCPRSEVDRYVKKRLFTDVLDICIRARSEPLHQIVPGDTYGSLIKIFPSTNPQHNDAYDKLKLMRDFFYKLGANQSHYQQISSKQFECLHTNKFLKKCKLLKIDLHILFQKAANNAKVLDYFGFNDLIKALYKKCRENKKV